MSNSNNEQWRVATTAASELEAELLRQRLAEVGIGAIYQRALGGPEWGPAGARHIYVQGRDLKRAQTLLQNDATAAR